MQPISQLIHSRWLLPIRPEKSILEHHSIAIDDGKIIDILPTHEASKRYEAAIVQHLDQHHVLMPGLINSHTHAAMSLLRGIADDIPLKPWLENHIWPLESKWVNRDFVADGVELAILEMVLSGTTCFNDMYFYPDISAEKAQAIGLRAVVGMIVIEFPSVWANDADEYLKKGLSLHDEWRDSERIKTVFAPHAPYTVSNETFKKIRVYADEIDTSIHIHLHETQKEIDDSIKEFGLRPLQRLDQLGLVNDRLLAVHMTQLNEREIELLQKSSAHVIHCPQANLKLGSGLCPSAKLMNAQINTALGTDGAASNNDLDLFDEMRTAALIGKLASNDASQPDAWQVLEMATINGAKALNLDKDIGSIEVGKQADLIAVNLNHPNSMPVHNPASQLVYSCSSQQVTHSWVNGQLIMENRALKHLNHESVLERARHWQRQISNT